MQKFNPKLTQRGTERKYDMFGHAAANQNAKRCALRDMCKDGLFKRGKLDIGENHILITSRKTHLIFNNITIVSLDEVVNSIPLNQNYYDR